MNMSQPGTRETSLDPVERVLRRRERRRSRARQVDLPRWPRRRLVRWFRRFVFRAILVPILRTGYSLSVTGREHATRVSTPVLVVSNHNMHLDQAMILRALPSRFRDRLTIAASAESIYGNRFRGFFASLLGNAFPFNRHGSGVRDSLDAVAQVLDEGWHVLIFPEGKLTVIGPMQPFKNGTGYLAVETGAPVLPLRIDVHRPGFYEGRWFPTPRAVVSVHIGPVLEIPDGCSYARATSLIEEAVRQA